MQVVFVFKRRAPAVQAQPQQSLPVNQPPQM
jgi:hypothetical protein